MKVFLGGTCAGWNWRKYLENKLKCDYYNPVVENWTEEDRIREVHERETADFILYGITDDMTGVYSIAEIVDDSNKRPEKTIFLNMYRMDKRYPFIERYKQVAKSLEAVENLLKENGVACYRSMADVASFLNNLYNSEEVVSDMINDKSTFNIKKEHVVGKINNSPYIRIAAEGDTDE